MNSRWAVAIFLLSLFPAVSFGFQGGSVNHIDCRSINKKIKESKQLIVVVSADWHSDQAETWRFDRGPDGRWNQVGSAIDTRLGKNGMGWGQGLQSVIGKEDVGLRRRFYRWEGDNKSPAGIFSLGATFGTHPDIQMWEKNKKRNKYVPVKKGLQCSDDFHSHFYNQFVVQSDYPGSTRIKGIPTATSKEIIDSEDMYAAANPDDSKYGHWLPYQLGIFINQNLPASADSAFKLGELRHDNYVLNDMPAEDWYKPETQEKLKSTDPAPYGSCIFLHVMQPDGEGTSGCTSMRYPDLEKLVKWRDESKYPLMIQLPKDQWDDIVNRCGDLPHDVAFSPQSSATGPDETHSAK